MIKTVPYKVVIKILSQIIYSTHLGPKMLNFHKLLARTTLLHNYDAQCEMIFP